MLFSTFSSTARIRSKIVSCFVSIAGVHNLIKATSSMILFCVAYFNCPESSEKTRIYRNNAAVSIIPDSSFNCIIFSVDTSRTSSILSDVFTRSKFLKYHVKSAVSCVRSLPCITSSSTTSSTPGTSVLITFRKSLLNTSVSTAPSTSKTCSYVTFCPR